MKPETAKEVGNFLGWCAVAAAISMAPIFVAGATLSAYGFDRLILIYSWVVIAVVSGAGIALIWHSVSGYYLLYLAAIASAFVPGIRLLPFIHRLTPAGPEADYLSMASNVLAVAVAAWCHWSISRGQDPAKGRRNRMSIMVAMAIFAMGLVYWKTGFRTGKGEVARVAEVPFVGSYLSPLESKGSLAFQSVEFMRRSSGTVVFHGSTSEENIKEFAAKYNLKQMTNAEARVKFLPILKSWKLDSEKFPLLNGPNDSCYIGRVPTNSALVLQICHRPSDGRFTAMAMGSPNQRKKR